MPEHSVSASTKLSNNLMDFVSSLTKKIVAKLVFSRKN